MNSPLAGTIGWIDITVPDAEGLRAFYEKVAGWRPHPVEMEGYSDYCMMPAGSDQPAAGICHARGVNSSLPPTWLIYITVSSVTASLEECTRCGGTVVVPEREMGGGRFAVIRDPAGAHCALFQPGEAP